MPSAQQTPIDFFISYAPADENWAIWIAWELEQAGYRTMLQAWDFVPGTNFIDFMDRGLTRSTVVLAVLSQHYLHSRYGRWEWQTAIRASPDDPGRRLITVRVAECELEGLLSTITFLNLVGIDDPDQARSLLLARIQQALTGRAKPDSGPGYPTHGNRPATVPGTPRGTARPVAQLHSRPEAVHAARFPAAPRQPVTLLHLTALRCVTTAHRYAVARRLHKRLITALDRAMASGAGAPDAVVISGDLTDSGGLRQFEEALRLLEDLRVSLKLPIERLALVPGPRDINRAASIAYFAACDGDEQTPQPPYADKWMHFMRLYDELYGDAGFTATQPWSMFVMASAGITVAGLNSTIADSHRDADHYGWLGPEQHDWFTEQLQPFDGHSWWRVAAIGHTPAPRSRSPYALRDTDRLRTLEPSLDVVLHNRRGRLGAALVSLSDSGTHRTDLLMDHTRS